MLELNANTLAKRLRILLRIDAKDENAAAIGLAQKGPISEDWTFLIF